MFTVITFLTIISLSYQYLTLGILIVWIWSDAVNLIIFRSTASMIILGLFPFIFYLAGGNCTLGPRWKNIPAFKQCLCKKKSSSGKICSKFYCVLSQKYGMMQFCAFIVIFRHFMNIYGPSYYFVAVYGTLLHTWHFLALWGTFWHFWPVTLFCGEFTLVTIYALFGLKLFLHKPCLRKFVVFFNVCPGAVQRW